MIGASAARPTQYTHTLPSTPHSASVAMSLCLQWHHRGTHSSRRSSLLVQCCRTQRLDGRPPEWPFVPQPSQLQQ